MRKQGTVGEPAARVFEEGLSRYLGPRERGVLARVRVGILGAGGLGSMAAQALVRTGVRHLVVADPDVVEASNLNRQFYFVDQVGRAKVEALGENLRRINPEVEVEGHRLEVRSAEELERVFRGCEVLVEAVDGAEVKRMVAEEVRRRQEAGGGPRGRVWAPYLLVSASGVAGWGAVDEVRVREVGEGWVVVGDGVREVGEGVPPLAPRVWVAASMEADAVVSFVLGHTRLWEDV
ncbi:sulfur carrier protein ThiS adenylyltransferase ThiF [Spirochaeta thermophila]|uniref:THIF-type NAD/FAD binding fold domain-containing protein n=1 Tax=Winmispira thermophila (strain ATCC 49972 / DSM 6192 / RI 19.B1) TaxID=665571 RepID=E0RNC1_WINT6|nr:sulfur carrier protein ThiS adenylyltransferase ThiF [Spirochaeta thermophila]ADN01121.1 hypothetical protein STHERM_c01450 [Spirochaeta thermophila DSM 6192]